MFNPDRLEALRISRNLSKAEFAKRIGVSRQAVDQWISGKAKPSVATLEHMSQLFNVACGYFFTDEAQQLVTRKAS